jgi:hypothetical protein
MFGGRGRTERCHEKIACNGNGYRGRTDEIPFPKCGVAHQVGVHLLPEAVANPGRVIQEPIPENLIKFFIKHISSAVL